MHLGAELGDDNQSADCYRSHPNPVMGELNDSMNIISNLSPGKSFSTVVMTQA